jgi:hypothetical protein
MRITSAALLAVLVSIASPAFSEDGAIPSSTLAALGLTDMELVSDSDAMQVRGLSSSASGRGTSLVFGVLVDPATPGNFFVASDVNGSGATAENGGWRVLSRASSGPQGSSGVGQLTIESGNPAIVVYNGMFAGNSGHAANIGQAGIAFGSGR